MPEFGTAAYPRPIVDEHSAVARAKQQLYGLRRTPMAHDEAATIQHRHGSRKSGVAPSGTGSRRSKPAAKPAVDEVQGRLF